MSADVSFPTKAGIRCHLKVAGAPVAFAAGATSWLDRMATVTALRSHADTPIATGNALELEGVSRSFGALRALEDVSIAVAAGERRAVIGANGAGKTTLFNVITGDFPATRGASASSATTCAAATVRACARRPAPHLPIVASLSRAYGSRQPVPGRARVARGRFSLLRPACESTTRASADDLLRRVRLESVADERVAVLSHGQQRQLEIGMALAGAPRLILFDEPAAGLSPAERRELVALLRALAGAHGLRADRARSRHRASRRRSRHRSAQRPRLKEGTPDEIENDAEVQAIYMGRRGH